MKYFINNDKKVYSFDLNNDIFSLYKKEGLVLTHKTKLKSVSLPVEPIIIDDIVIIFDYENGIELIKNNDVIFINIRAVYKAKVIGDYLFAFTQKKMYVINYNTGVIVNEKNVSENFQFSSNDDYAFFYRIYRNKSFLYQVKTNKVIELSNSLEKELLILKIMSLDDLVYILTSDPNKIKVILQIKINTLEMNKDYIYSKWATCGFKFIDYFNPIVNPNIVIKSNDYCELIYLAFKKYGIFIAYYIADKKMLSECENSKYHFMYDYYVKYEEMMDKYRPLRSFNDLIEVENKVNDITNAINNCL